MESSEKYFTIVNNIKKLRIPIPALFSKIYIPNIASKNLFCDRHCTVSEFLNIT